MTHLQGGSRRKRRALIFLIIALILLGFGISPSDEAAYRTFSQAVDRWQVQPEFRGIATEYSILGSAAVRTRPWGMPTGQIVLALRSAPMLPKKYAVNPTSQLHYQNFGRGPLVAYLHLTSEQSVSEVAGIIESIGKSPHGDEADDRQVLDAFKMDFPVTKDAGALYSAKLLLSDIDASRPFKVRDDIVQRLRPHIAAIAGALHISPDPRSMSPQEQRAVLDRLDDEVHAHDSELWRSKQISDFAAGVWAQVFGPPYNGLVVPFLWVHDISRFLLVVTLMMMVGRLLAEKKRLAAGESDAIKLDSNENLCQGISDKE